MVRPMSLDSPAYSFQKATQLTLSRDVLLGLAVSVGTCMSRLPFQHSDGFGLLAGPVPPWVIF